MRLRVFLFAIVAVFAVCLSASAWGQGGIPGDRSSSLGWQGEPADRIVGPIDSSQRVVTNGVHPLALRQNDRGRVNSAQVFHRMVLLLEGSDAQEQALKQLLSQQQDPSSPEYHQWLTPAEFGRRFGPSENDLATLCGWLKKQGFTVEPAPNGRRYLIFSGTSGQVEAAFQTEMHRYAVNGVSYMANAMPASVPRALAGVVKGVASLTSFHPMLPQSWPANVKEFQIQAGVAATGPADLMAIYDATPLNKAGVQGQGESVALIEESNIVLQDLTDFRNVTGLPAADVNVILNGPDPGPLDYDGEEFEAIADTEYAGAMAPQATLNVVVTESTELTQGILLSTFYAVDNVVSPVTSLSYGGCETLNDTYYAGVPQAFAAAYEQGAAEGISQYVSSGDYGGDACEGLGLSAGYGVNAIGDSPWNVSVGGTEFIMPDPNTYFPPPNYAATGYIPERTWNDYENPEDGRPIAGSGGVSITFTKPAWQTGPGVPVDGQRDVPDVSLLAGDNLYYLTCEADIGYDCAKGEGGGVIGTSLASPNWAAIQTLVNQKNSLAGGAGNPNPTYYRLAVGSGSPFHDITVGDTKVPDLDSDLVGYAATPGFDLATGLGSVDVNALATKWLPPTGSGTAKISLTTSTQSITHGGALTANITVTASGSTAPTGDVVLMAGSQGAVQVTLTTGVASYTFGPSTGITLPGGSYKLIAHYAGDANFAAADSSPVALTVAPEATSTQAFVPGTATYGETLTLSTEAVGAVSEETVPGSYTFTGNGATLGKAAIAMTGDRFSAGIAGVIASLSLDEAQSLPAGTYSITAASPAASASFFASTSSAVSLTVSKAPVLVSLSPDHTTPPLNSTVNLLATVENLYGYLAPVTGAVDFFDGNTKIGSGTLATKADPLGAYDVTVPVKFTTAGLHTLVARYEGDGNDLANASGLVNVTVSSKSSSSITAYGPGFGLAQTATQLTAYVTGDASTTPTGTVTFSDAATNGATLGTAQVGANGVVTFNANMLAAGSHYVVATYGGDANFIGSASQSLPIVVGDFTLTPSPTSASAIAGQSTAAITLTYSGTTDFSKYLAGSPYASSGVTLACTGLPSGAGCDFTSTNIVPTANQNGTTTGTTTMTISTEGPTLQMGRARRPGGALPAALAGLLALGLPLVLRRRRWFASLLGLAILFFAAGLNGCASATTHGYEITNPGTPAGASTITVTATISGGAAGTLSHTATITLTVTAAGQ